MNNNTMKKLVDDLKVLKADLDNTQDMKKLQRDIDEAQDIIADLTKKVEELTAIQEYDPAVFLPKIAELESVRLTAQGKLDALEAALSAARESHKTAYAEYERIKKGIETLNEMNGKDYQKMVDNIKSPQA